MESQDIHKIAVIGAGNMGPGISQVFGQAGYSVTINDIDQGTRDGQKSYDQVMQKISGQLLVMLQVSSSN